MTTTLVIPSKITEAVKPKPTKNEIISAMVQLHLKKHDEEQKVNIARRESLEKELRLLIKDHALKNIQTLSCELNLGREDKKWNGSAYIKTGKIEGVSAIYAIPKLPKHIADLLKEYHSLPTCTRMLDARDVKKMIALKLDGIGTETERVESLLTDQESRKGLEKMLRHIGL